MLIYKREKMVCCKFIATRKSQETEASLAQRAWGCWMPRLQPLLSPAALGQAARWWHITASSSSAFLPCKLFSSSLGQLLFWCEYVVSAGNWAYLLAARAFSILYLCPG